MRTVSCTVRQRCCVLPPSCLQTHFALFFNQGQCCCAGSRIFVHEAIYDAFVAAATARAQRRTVGDGLSSGAEQGPQVDEEQFNKVLGYVKSGVDEGATLKCGGTRVGTSGYFVAPTVFADVTDNMKIAREEIFGPVMQILKFKDTEEVRPRRERHAFPEFSQGDNITKLRRMSRSSHDSMLQVIRRSNDSDYGLAAAIFTKSLDTASGI